MKMDLAPLNKAHQLERRAESLNKQKRFDECIECHKNIVKLLGECCKLTKNPLALESIRLQKEFNERQIKTMQLKKSYLKRSENEKKQTVSKNNLMNVDENLETKIFRTIETHDSLICYLGQKGIITSGANNICGNKTEKEEKESSPPIFGNKHPKDDSTVIEELKLLSGQLRESVQGLLVQLDDRNKEIEKLKKKIRTLEVEKCKDNSRNSLDLKIVTDSSGGTSPLIFSPCSERSPDITDLRSLPPLEPLEMPNFNFTNLKQLGSPN
ncbi:nuclear receptor-binding factor 2-like [Cylas formicarius]|uniref:nuclear receptor-binding factor 2-like n=1 Tax=Cylas formicarius TaxID=197179 RepID=UPI002958B3F9|nr:nuclear receptor-binding factor 2-like [Cylas formicarius]